MINRLPESVAEEIREQHEQTGRILLNRAYARVRSRTGQLRAGLGYRVTPKTLKLRFGILGKALNRRLYYGWFVEQGRKAGGRGIKRGSAKYARGVGAIAARHFVYATPREQIYRPYQRIWGRALHRAAAGATDS